MKDKGEIKSVSIETNDKSTEEQIKTIPIESITTYTEHNKKKEEK